MIVKCTNCGGSHPKWDCTRPKKKSTAPEESRTSRSASANESAPVDTHPDVAQRIERVASNFEVAGSSPAVRATFDRNEYQRLYMRDKATIKRQGLNMTVKQYRESLK